MPATDDVNRTAVPPSVTTPSRVESGIGTLEFTDGYPTSATAAGLRDHLDYLHGVETFMNTIQGVSVFAIRKGFQDAGIADGDVLIFSELMDSRSLFLTANADTVYFWSFHDLSQGPLVIETPSDTFWASSTTSGSAGSATSACPVRTAARAGPTCWSAPSTTARCPKVATTCGTRAPTS